MVESTPQHDRRRTTWLVLFAALVFLPSLIGRELIPPDEPRFALIAREMYESGDLVVMTRHGERYLDKPPLLIWLEALGYALTGGPNDVAARFPVVIATLLLTALLHRAGRQWVGEPIATQAVLIWLSVWLVLWRGAWLSPDTWLAAGLLGTLWGLSLPASAERSARVITAAMLGLALLAKGPVALLFIVFAWCAARAAGTELWSWRRLRNPLTLLLLGLVVLPWPLAYLQRVGIAPLWHSLWVQNGRRLLGSWDNVEPWHFQITALIGGFFPWSVLLIPLCDRTACRQLWADRQQRTFCLFVGAALCFFSIPQGKRSIYLLPVYPFLALLAAKLVAIGWGDRRRRIWLTRVAAGLAVILGLLSLYLLVGPLNPRWKVVTMLPIVRLAGATVVAIAAISLAGLAWGVARGRSGALRAPAGAALVLGLLYPPLFTPALNAAQAAAAARVAIDAVLPADVPVGFGRTKSELVSWYTGRRGPRLESPRQILDFLQLPGRRAVLARDEELPPESEWPAGAVRHEIARLGRLKLRLVVKSAPPSPG